jgi:hypothetical protein
MPPYPVRSSGWHGHGLDAAGLPPLRHAMPIGGEAAEAAHRLGIAVGRPGDMGFGAARIDTCGLQVQHGRAFPIVSSDFFPGTLLRARAAVPTFTFPHWRMSPPFLFILRC